MVHEKALAMHDLKLDPAKVAAATKSCLVDARMSKEYMEELAREDPGGRHEYYRLRSRSTGQGGLEVVDLASLADDDALKGLHEVAVFVVRQCNFFCPRPSPSSSLRHFCRPRLSSWHTLSMPSQSSE